jgi:hypothetical protein
MTGRAGVSFLETGKKKIEEAEKEVEKASVEMTVSKFKKPTASWATKIGYLNRLIKQGDIDEALEKGLTGKEILQAVEQAKQYDAHKDIISAVPHLFEPEILRKAMYREPPISLSQAYAEEIISKIKPQRAGQLSKEALDNDSIIKAIAMSWDGRHIAKLIEAHGRKAADRLEEVISREANLVHKTAEQWLRDVNPRLAQYMKSSIGRVFFKI